MEECFRLMFADFQDPNIQKEQLPWFCPQCNQRFKWDIQLLRHERKTGHQNPDRQLRKIKKANKREFKECGYCKQRFTDQMERLSHYPWCERNPNNSLAPYCSTSEHSKYECNKHDATIYFMTVKDLREHLSTHRKKKQNNQGKMKEQIQQKGRRSHLQPHALEKLQRQLSKVRGLKKKRAQSLAQLFNVSVATVRKYYSKINKKDSNTV